MSHANIPDNFASISEPEDDLEDDFFEEEDEDAEDEYKDEDEEDE